MRTRFRCLSIAAAATVLVVSISGAARPLLTGSFASDMDQAMATMDKGMMASPTGQVDQDFVTMMVPHHQGAIDMAVAEIRYGHDEQLKRIAQEIIVDQQQEIAAMRLALGQPLPPSTTAPTQFVQDHQEH